LNDSDVRLLQVAEHLCVLQWIVRRIEIIRVTNEGGVVHLIYVNYSRNL